TMRRTYQRRQALPQPSRSRDGQALPAEHRLQEAGCPKEGESTPRRRAGFARTRRHCEPPENAPPYPRLQLLSSSWCSFLIPRGTAALGAIRASRRDGISCKMRCESAHGMKLEEVYQRDLAV